MSLDRAERTGLGVAFAGHVLLFAVLSLGWLASRPPAPMTRAPVEVQLVDEVGPQSAAPVPAVALPAPKLAPEEGPVVPPAAPPEPQPEPKPAPLPRQEAPVPAPTPRPVKRSVQPAPAAPAPPEARPAPKAMRPTGRLRGLLTGLSDQDSPSRSTAPAAEAVSLQAQTSILQAVLAALRQHWTPPSGADVELLKTKVRFRLARDGSLISVEADEPTGITASNRAQAGLYRNLAIRAVRLAAPFHLPPQYYEGRSGWNTIEIEFNARLSG